MLEAPVPSVSPRLVPPRVTVPRVRRAPLPRELRELRELRVGVSFSKRPELVN